MNEHVAALSLKSMNEVKADVSNFILTTGMSPAQLKGTERICLGVGYRTDDMDVALGSALLLHAMGQGVYGELMGHQLAQGFGTAQRTEMARGWYEDSLRAGDSGAEAGAAERLAPAARARAAQARAAREGAEQAGAAQEGAEQDGAERVRAERARGPLAERCHAPDADEGDR